MNDAISPIQRLVGFGRFPGLHITRGPRISRFNGEIWIPEDAPPVAAGTTSQWCKFRNGYPNVVLTFEGQLTRYWDLYTKRIGASGPVRTINQRTTNIWRDGAPFRTAPDPVIGCTIIYHETLQREYLVSVCTKTQFEDEFHAMDLSDEAANWISCGEILTDHLTDFPNVDLPSGRDGEYADPKQAHMNVRGSWFFSATGNKAVCLREFSISDDVSRYLTDDIGAGISNGFNDHPGFLRRYDLAITQNPDPLNPFSVFQTPSQIETGEVEFTTVENESNGTFTEPITAYSFEKTVAVDFDGDAVQTLSVSVAFSDDLAGNRTRSLEIKRNGNVLHRVENEIGQPPYHLIAADLRAGTWFAANPKFENTSTPGSIGSVEIWENGIYRNVQGQEFTA